MKIDKYELTKKNKLWKEVIIMIDKNEKLKILQDKCIELNYTLLTNEYKNNNDED